MARGLARRETSAGHFQTGHRVIRIVRPGRRRRRHRSPCYRSLPTPYRYALSATRCVCIVHSCYVTLVIVCASSLHACMEKGRGVAVSPLRERGGWKKRSGRTDFCARLAQRRYTPAAHLDERPTSRVRQDCIGRTARLLSAMFITRVRARPFTYYFLFSSSLLRGPRVSSSSNSLSLSTAADEYIDRSIASDARERIALSLARNANSTVLILHPRRAIGITIAESIGTTGRGQICPSAGREQQAGDMQTSECRRAKRERESE